VTRLYAVHVDPARCDNWAMANESEHRGLRLADLLLLLLILRGSGIPHRVTRDHDDQREEAAA
jgi:hypothetical protein